MPLRRSLFTHRQVGLHMLLIRKIIGLIPAALSSVVHKVLSQLQITLLSRIMIELHKGKLDLLMSRRVKGRAVLYSEHTVDQIRIPDGNPEHVFFAGGLRIGNGSLDQMPCTVKLMIRPPGKPGLWLHHRKIGIEITILPLGALHPRYQFIDPILQLLIPLLLQKVRRSLNPLCHIRLPEDMGLTRHPFFPVKFQRLKPPCLLETVVHRVNGHSAEQLLILFPEASGNPAFLKAYRC